MLSEKTEKEKMWIRLQKCGGCYLLGGCFAIWLKYRYSHAGSGELLWLLQPVAWWAGRLGRMSFEYEKGIGYVNHAVRFIIAPSCSGVQFFIIVMLMLLFAFVHRMGTRKKRWAWMVFGLFVAYGYTVFVNGIRIVLAVELPLFLARVRFCVGWLSPERLHTLIGVAVYFTALILLYQAVDAAVCFRERGSGKDNPDIDTDMHGNPKRKHRYLIPAFWYFFIVLGVPFLNRAVADNRAGFIEYAFVTAGGCLGVLTVLKAGKKLLHGCRRA